MHIIEHRAIPGANHYSPYPVVRMLLDLEELAETTTAQLPGFPAALQALLPSLAEHRCSPETPGGFLTRMKEGTLLGHVVEHVAIELQCLAGMHVGFGKTRSTKHAGEYEVAYRYRDAEAGIEAGRMAVEILEGILVGNPPPLAPLVDELRSLQQANALGPSTQAIVNEARRRGIPVTRLDKDNYIQLGQGARMQKLQASLTGRTSCIGTEIADDKDRTKGILSDAGIPVPRGDVVSTWEGVVDAAQDLGFPVVLKPLVGNHGRGVTTDIMDLAQLRKAYDSASAVNRHIVVEQCLQGADFRVLVINSRFVAAARRDPACVTGDGTRTIRQLVEEANRDPRRGEAHDNFLTRIDLDDHSAEMLARQGLTPDSIPLSGAVVRLKGTANLSTGGTATDVTAEVHPTVRLMCERASRLVGLDIMGLDIVAPHLRLPLKETRGGVVEVNAAPGLRMHAMPSNGRPLNVGAPIIDMLFPGRQDGRIPVVAVTGTNGKTTTVRLINHVLRSTGAKVGLTTTSGVEIDGNPTLDGDYSGPDGARVVFGDPLVDHAVLEVARGGILRRGLGFDRCDVGVLLNVASDHLGEGGIETLQDLADVKAVVVEAVARNGTAVLNADDDLVHAYADRLRSNVTLFSLDGESRRIAAHVQRAGKAVTLSGNSIVVRDSTGDEIIGDLRDVPVTLKGAARFNVANVLATVAACRALGVPAESIRKALESFHPTPENLPGRLNLIDMGGYKVLVDYGHNVPALLALQPVVRSLAEGRVIAMANSSGNRRDEDILAFGNTVGSMYDHVVLCDPDPRGREPGETMRMVREGVVAGGLAPESVETAASEAEAIQHTLELAQPGDLVVLQVDNIKQAFRMLDEARRAHEGTSRPVRRPRVRPERAEDTDSEAVPEGVEATIGRTARA
ncbi:MAG TPA: cyanophycin synthetase [Candidatus Thermoplasmatota archaeon]|nr:cyanophycin synthetase [Candidatus Thermoplasmatota archaeon]